MHVAVNHVSIEKFESNKARALLAYLVIERVHPHQREFLANLLWPDLTEHLGMANLRHALANLHKILDDPAINASSLIQTRMDVQFHHHEASFCDVDRFNQLIEEYKRHPMKPALLERAVALYRGCFMDSFKLNGCSDYESWVLMKREEFHRPYMHALGNLYKAYEQVGAFEKAEQCARLQVCSDPLNEAGQQYLMRILALTGNRSAALRQYTECRHLFQVELGVEPSASIRCLYERIRDETFPNGSWPALHG
jgi:DNA-binding SARP family transcriptional activator